MVAELKYEISQNAYIKLVLQALKHKTTAVNGVLLGRVNPQNENVVEIIDSVPLFHSNLALLPPLEIALIMVEEHYGSQGLGIVGYFHANERFDNAELGIVAKNIGDHICRYFPQAALLLLDNKKLEALSKEKDQSPVMQVYLVLDLSALVIVLSMVYAANAVDLPDSELYIRDASKNWKLVGPDGGSRLVIKEPAANVVLLDFISSEKWQDVADFDDHLDDIKKDWLNPDLFK
ncbi:ER membrane protein complex subunit 8/9 - like 1 [Theobroma cacao]|nr:ER membrane protein complex subunit 8/9 - like 1 [Theobroma cacao]